MCVRLARWAGCHQRRRVAALIAVSESILWTSNQMTRCVGNSRSLRCRYAGDWCSTASKLARTPISPRIVLRLLPSAVCCRPTDVLAAVQFGCVSVAAPALKATSSSTRSSISPTIHFCDSRQTRTWMRPPQDRVANAARSVLSTPSKPWAVRAFNRLDDDVRYRLGGRLCALLHARPTWACGIAKISAIAITGGNSNRVWVGCHAWSRLVSA